MEKIILKIIDWCQRQCQTEDLTKAELIEAIRSKFTSHQTKTSAIIFTSGGWTTIMMAVSG
jgi:RNase adaptor protein for sRNA GlmZ degradation